VTAADFARAVVTEEIGEPPDPDRVVAAGQRVCRRACAGLGAWIGRDGCHALLARALEDARGRHSWLVGVRILGGEEACLDGFEARASRQPPGEVRRVLEEVFTSFVELFGHFVGPVLALQIIRDAAPTATSFAEPAAAAASEPPGAAVGAVRGPAAPVLPEPAGGSRADRAPAESPGDPAHPDAGARKGGS
jgi:hypothetical protein